MARKVVLVSDISGKEADESEFTKLVVRQHPAVKEPKQLDVLPAEVKVKEASNLVVFEVGENGDKKTYTVPLDEFRKLVSDDVVKGAAGTRGRRVGTTVKK